MSSSSVLFKQFMLKLWFCLSFLVVGAHLFANEPLGTPDRDDLLYPDDELDSKEWIDLGKVLFFDPRLSGNKSRSCATCHNPALGFGDGMALTMGIGR